MPRSVLIPVDFRIESLNTLKFALGHHADQDVVVVLVYAVALTMSITDLLFYSRERMRDAHSTPAFDEALAILKNKHASIVKRIVMEPFHGVTQGAFSTFIEAHRIDEAYVPRRYRLAPIERCGFDILPFIRRSVLPVHEVDWDIRSDATGRDDLDALFSNSPSIDPI